jgi:tight adherence protein C
MVLILILVLAVGAVMLGAWSASTVIESRAAAQRSVDIMAGYEKVDVRDQEMMKSLGERVLAPAVDGLGKIAQRFTPAGYVQKIKRDIVFAGNPPGYEVDRFLIWKVLGAASGLLWVPLVLLVLSGNRLVTILAIVVLWGGSFMLPDITLTNKIDRRREEIARNLSDTLDLLVISVEAGLGFEQALERTSNTIEGPLSEEMRRVLQEIRMGASRADALRALDERTNVDDLKTFVVAMLQADTFGISVSRILRSQADEIRTRRRQAAQEKSQKAPIKMLFPLTVCIFPAIFVVVLVPGLIQVFNKL